MLERSLPGYTLGTTDLIAFDSDEGIILSTSNDEVLGILPGTEDG